MWKGGMTCIFELILEGSEIMHFTQLKVTQGRENGEEGIMRPWTESDARSP